MNQCLLMSILTVIYSHALLLLLYIDHDNPLYEYFERLSELLATSNLGFKLSWRADRC